VVNSLQSFLPLPPCGEGQEGAFLRGYSWWNKTRHGKCFKTAIQGARASRNSNDASESVVRATIIVSTAPADARSRSQITLPTSCATLSAGIELDADTFFRSRAAVGARVASRFAGGFRVGCTQSQRRSFEHSGWTTSDLKQEPDQLLNHGSGQHRLLSVIGKMLSAIELDHQRDAGT